MRKYKQVKEKKVTYSIEEWQEVERRADLLFMKTGTYIKNISVKGQIVYYNIDKAATLLNALRIIGNNINQLAKKANEINSVYAGDYNKMKAEYENLCLMLNQFLSTLPSTTQ